MLSLLMVKMIAIAVVSGGSMFFGLLPVALKLGARYSNTVTMSALLTFGGGVLFATSIVHILPSIQKDLPNWSELVFSAGFLLIYFVDTVVSLVRTPSSPRVDRRNYYATQRQSYGAIDQDEDTRGQSNESLETITRPINTSTHFSLLIAFSVHSLFEGLVIGVEKTTFGVILLLTAVCCHKLLVAFCLGTEFSSDGQSFSNVIPPLSVFVVSSALGIGFGSLIQPDSGYYFLAPVLQGLAGGTLLYVVVCEILPREKGRRLPLYAGLVQFFALVLGFSFITVLTIFTDEAEE